MTEREREGGGGPKTRKGTDEHLQEGWEKWFFCLLSCLAFFANVSKLTIGLLVSVKES